MSIFARLREDALDTGRAVLDAVYPAHCVCAPDEPLATRPAFGLCDVCVANLEPNGGQRCAVCDHPGGRCCAPGSDLRMRAPYLYSGPLTDAVHAIKFGGRDDLARGLGRLLAEHPDIGTLARECDQCVPVPLSTARARQRGYNQSAILARAVARALGMPVRHDLRRTRDTAPQHTLDAIQRGSNVRDAFDVKGPVIGSVLLIDDVITSGETVRAAARALLDAGAHRVVAIALGRTPRAVISAPAFSRAPRGFPNAAP
ncbi:MAG: ComF family protein [Myxococcota bacterium]|nr:ComF family protein [Myxococcota bacterium]